MAYNLKERRFMSVKMYKILLKAKYQKAYPRGVPLKVQGLSGKMMNVFRIYLSSKMEEVPLCTPESIQARNHVTGPMKSYGNAFRRKSHLTCHWSPHTAKKPNEYNVMYD